MNKFLAAVLVACAAGVAHADKASCDMEVAKCNGDKMCEMHAWQADACKGMAPAPSVAASPVAAPAQAPVPAPVH